MLVDQLAALPTAGRTDLALVPRRQRRHVNNRLTALAADGFRTEDPDFLFSPADAERLGLHDGDQVTVRSAYGALAGRAQVDADIRTGALAVPHGFEDVNVNELTSTRYGVDPVSA